MAKNFAYSLVATAPSPATSGASLVVTAADGTKFPTTPFPATIWPASSRPTTANAEIVIVTGVSTDTLTITRAQEGTSARTVIVGDQIAATMTADLMVQNNKFTNQSATDQNIVLRAGQAYTVPEVLQIGSTQSLTIPATSSLEIASYIKQADGVVGNLALTAGAQVQCVSSLSTANASGTTTIPLDNTIPQNTEGDQYLSVSITPKSASNTLVIQVVATLSHSIGAVFLIAALFQDANVNAVAANLALATTATGTVNVVVSHTMTAGTVSATTFKVRAGSNTAGTTSLNTGGGVGADMLGAITKSSIIVWEYKS